MRIVVCVKTNLDLQMVRIRGREPVLEAVPYKVGDLEKNALEAALKLKEGGLEATIVAVTVAEGDRKIGETLKEALAIGADEAVVVNDPALAATDQAAVAAALAGAIGHTGGADLVLCGEGSTDGYSGIVGSRVAELLGVPQLGYARSVTVTDGAVTAERSLDDQIETLRAPLPALVSVVSEINEPRIPGLMQIMKAGKKPLTELTLADLGIDPQAAGRQTTVLSDLAEEQDRKHIMIEGDAAEQAAGLVDALAKEGVLRR